MSFDPDLGGDGVAQAQVAIEKHAAMFLTRDRDKYRVKTCELEEALETVRMAVLGDGSAALKDLLIERGLGKMTLVDVRTFLAAIRQVTGLEKKS